MGIDTARFLDLLQAAKNWCEHPGRFPLQKKEKEEPTTKNTAVDLVHHCFVCGNELTQEIQGEESS